jgi:hypothetical protein
MRVYTTNALHLIVLAFLCTPSYSLIFTFSNIYVANEKIAFLICLFLLLYNGAFRIPKPLIKLASASALLFFSLLFISIIRYYLSGIPLSATNANYFISFLEVVVFCIFFLRQGFILFLRSLLSVVYLQFAGATIQVIFIISGNSNLTTIFSNHYAKTEYKIPFSYVSLPRPFGFFNEASELSAFFAICIVCMFMLKYLNTSKYYLPPKVCSLTIILCLVGIIFTFSLTGILMLSGCSIYFVIAKSIENRFTLKITKNSLYLFAIAVLSLVYLYEPLTKLAFSTFTSSSRAVHTYNALNDILFQYGDFQLLFGSAAVWEDATWDIITRTIQIYGIVGLSFVSIYILIVVIPLNIFSVLFLCFLLSNASPASSIFMFAATTTVLLPGWVNTSTKFRIGF